MRQFYIAYPIGAKPSHQLSWSHYVELLKIDDGLERNFYEQQYHIVLGNRPHYVDLVFYHRILKCFVLLDLKREEAGYEDIGQMNMNLTYPTARN